MSTESNNAASIQNASAGSVNGDASHSRRQSAVSLPKGANSSARPGQAINFGSVHDQNAMLSSSPAVQPSSGQHLHGEKPTVFGSVTAHDSESKKTTIGFASGKTENGSASSPATGANPRSLDFQKLFQGSGSPAQNPSGSPGSTAASPQPAQAQAAAPNVPAGSSPAPPAPYAAQPPNAQMPRHPPSNLRPPTGPGHHNGPRPFEPQRSPSQHHNQGARVPSQAGPHQGFPPHPAHGHPQPGPQQPRSPHMANAAPMQPMQPMGGPWGQPQQPMGFPPQYGYHPGYGYPAVPPQHWGQQQPQGYEIPGTPRSPRHANISPSPMGPGGLPPTPSMAPSTPLAARTSNVPPSPQTAHSSVSSPSHHGAPLSMGQPQGGRPQSFASPSPSFAHHSPSHSFSNPMSPSARQFEPQQKRQSSAIRIVNPETQAAVDLQSIQRTPSSANAQAAGTSSPSLSKASPAVVVPAERKPVRMETQEAFMRRVQEKKQQDEAKKKAELEAAAKKAEADDAEAAAAKAKEEQEKQEKEKKEAEEKAAKEKAEAEAAAAKKAAEEEAAAKKKAEQEEAERQRKAKEEEAAAAAAAKREAEEKAAAEKKAAEEAKAKEEAERKEREAKEEAERKEREAKEAEEKAAKEKAEAEAAAAKKAAEEEAAAAAARAKEAEEAKSKPAPIDTKGPNQAGEGEPAGDKANADAAASAAFRVADVERMAREASSVPSTPLDALPPRTPGVPQTPRTPGTPGFAGLPAKPMSSLPPSNGIKLDNEALEKKKRTGAPGNIDITSAQQAPHGDAPPSAASNALGSARFIDNINKVSYPSNISSPRVELNESAEPGKFRYDREFLMQFMNVYTEKPQDLPPLASIGMDGGMGAGGRPGGGRRASGMGPPPPPGRAQGLGISGSSNFGGKGAGIGAFSHPPKTSEERFAASSGSRGPGGMGAFGPMGSFTAGARSQPLSRTGSGSAALPSRDMMGTGVPSGGRTKSNRGRQRDPNSSRGPQVNPPEKGGPTIPLDQVVPLANSENRWMPQGRASTVKADSPEMVQRKVKALLNKLTLEKFDSISNQILEWANRSVNENDGRTLRQVIQLIFEKATDEAAWSEMYARLCRKIMEELSPEVKDESLRTADGKAVVGGSLFRKYLLNRCQEDFERGWAQRDTAVAAAKSKEAEDKAKKESNDKAAEEAREAEKRGEKPDAAPKEAELLSEEYYEAQKAKRRGLGLVKFIGELFKLSMLTERIMHLCIKKLLSNATDPEEEEIESLCKLMTTVGKLLDTEKARGHMDIYFTRMREMSQNEASINSRMRFMLLDVIELRDSHWTPRHDNSAPKTIAQIHADAAKAKAQAEAEAAARQSRGGPISRGGSKRGQARGEHGPDGWSTVGGPPAPPRPSKAGDLSAFGKIERGGSNRPLSFGPSGVFGKKNQGKGSEDGSQPPTRTNSQTNMFSLLNQSGDGEAAPAAAEEPQRPKLNLLPRTKPVAAAAAEKTEDKADKPELSDQDAKRKIDNDIKEFLEIKDIKEGVAAYKELPSKHRSEFVDKIVGTVLEKSKSDVENVAALFAKLSSEGVLDEATAVAGFEPHMELMQDASIDIPNIYTFMASLLVCSKVSQEKIEELGDKIVGQGIKSPKDQLLEKVKAARESA